MIEKKKRKNQKKSGFSFLNRKPKKQNATNEKDSNKKYHI